MKNNFTTQRTTLLRLVSALLAEISEEWETGKIYLNMKCQILPPA